MSPRVALFVGLTLGLPCTAFELRKDSQGDFVRFAQRAEFVLDADLAIQLKEGHADAAVKAAITALDEATPGCDVSVRVGKHREIGYVAGEQNQNDIFVLDEWPYDENALAATIITVNLKTNEIIDADIVFNADDHHFRVVDQLPHGDQHDDADDVQNTITHELGHALGLMHNLLDVHVVMYPSAQPLETSKRVLAQDDRDGLLELYAARATAPELSPPAGAFGCSATPSSTGSALAMMVGIAMLLRRRRTAVMVALLVPVGVLAADPSRETPDLVQAERVAVAEVTARTSSRVAGARGLLMTDLQLTVRDCVKGECARTLTVRVPGGRLGDLEQVVAHHPVPAINEAVVVIQGPKVRTVLRLADPGHFERAERAFSRAGLALPVSMVTHASRPPPSPGSQVPVVAP